MSVIEEYEHEGVKVQIHHEDEDARYADPRDMDNLGVMFCWHPDYVLGDEQFGQEGGRREDLTFYTMEEVVSYLQSERLAKVILPLFLLDHSGITISAGEPILGDPTKESNQERIKSRGRFMGDDTGWDTTHVGFIYTNDEQFEKIGTPPELALQVLREEVKTYAAFLEGRVYGYVAGKDTPFEDSCWGYVGEEDYVREEANRAAEDVAENLERESEEAAHWAARDTVTV